MSRIKATDDQLRSQIEATTADIYSTQPIEDRIATSLLATGRFDGKLNSQELAIILRNLVYTVFAEKQIGGRDIGLVHNVPNMKVKINCQEADVAFVVHLHKPIVAFLEFEYSLMNDPVSIDKKLRIKRGSLKINEYTRRFDLKAKTALATVNIENIARQELADPGAIILSTLPPQLKQRGADGKLNNIALQFNDHHLELSLAGEFWPYPEPNLPGL